MMIPIIYPSAGEFWFHMDTEQLINHSFINWGLTGLPPDQPFGVTTEDVRKVAKLLNLKLPLYLISPHENYKRKGKSCIIRAQTMPFSADSFIHLTYDMYDIYIASPELCFLQASRLLNFTDLVKLGYEMCATYCIDSSSKFGVSNREPLTSTERIKTFLDNNHSLYGAAKTRNALRYVHDSSNSPVETQLAMFSNLHSKYGGCQMTKLKMNPLIKLTKEGIQLTGNSHLRGDLMFYDRLVVDYNSNKAHLNPNQYAIDMNRKTAINLAGYDYVTLTYGNIKDYHSLIDSINSIRFLLHMKQLEPDNDARRALYYRIFKNI